MQPKRIEDDGRIALSSAAPAGAERRRRLRPDGGTKPVDLAYLGRFTLGNTELEREVLFLFVEHGPRYLDAMRTATSAKDWHAGAHTLKGAARGIGAWRVARSAEAAERFVWDRDVDRRVFALDHIQEALDEVIGYIRTLHAAS